LFDIRITLYPLQELGSTPDGRRRIAPMFETATDRYAWIDNIVAVGVGERLADGVRYKVFEIL